MPKYSAPPRDSLSILKRGWDSLVGPAKKRGRTGGVERCWDSLVAPGTKKRRPGGVERVWDSLVAPRTKWRRPGGVERVVDSVVAPRTKRGDHEVWRGAGTQWSYLEQRRTGQEV